MACERMSQAEPPGMGPTYDEEFHWILGVTPMFLILTEENSVYFPTVPMGRGAVKVMMLMSGFNKKGNLVFAHEVAGFTLLEILLVLTIIGMASIFIVPNVSNLESRNFTSQVRQAVSLLNYARRTAIVQGSPASVEFYTRPIAESEISDSAISVGYWEFIYGAMTFVDSTDIELEVDDKREIVFYPEGGSTGGTFFLSYQGRESKIEIDSFSGRVRSTNEN